MRRDAVRWALLAAPFTCRQGAFGSGALGPAHCSSRKLSAALHTHPTENISQLKKYTIAIRPRTLTMTTTQILSSESTVSTFSRTCDRLLQQLLQNAEASLLFDARARDQAENNLERFRIWGNNIAAFKTPRSTASLEYRLRDAPQVLDRFKSRLQELIDSSTQGTNELRS